MKQRHNPPVELGIKIQVDAIALKKLMLWTDIAQGEVSSLGIVEEIKNPITKSIEVLRVTDFYLVKQICSASETSMNQEEIANLLIELETQGIDSGKIKCWAHSHGSMSVFWSSTDDDTIKRLSNSEYLLSLVVNKQRETMMRLDVFHLLHLCVGDTAYEVHYPFDDNLEIFCRQEFAEKVSENSMITKSFKRRRKHQADEIGEIEIIDDNPECEFLGSSFNELEEQDDDFTYY